MHFPFFPVSSTPTNGQSVHLLPNISRPLACVTRWSMFCHWLYCYGCSPILHVCVVLRESIETVNAMTEICLVESRDILWQVFIVLILKKRNNRVRYVQLSCGQTYNLLLLGGKKKQKLLIPFCQGCTICTFMFLSGCSSTDWAFSSLYCFVSRWMMSVWHQSLTPGPS